MRDTKGRFIKGKNPEHAKFMRGRKHSKDTRERMSLAHKKIGTKPPIMRAEKHPKWKGEKAGYRAIHIWLQINYGEPTTCEHCQTGNLTGHKIHWANKSGNYLRNREDWLRLCVRCHKLFDKQKKLCE